MSDSFTGAMLIAIGTAGLVRLACTRPPDSFLAMLASLLCVGAGAAIL